MCVGRTSLGKRMVEVVVGGRARRIRWIDGGNVVVWKVACVGYFFTSCGNHCADVGWVGQILCAPER